MFSFASVWIFDESEIFSQVSSYQLIGFCLNMKFIQALQVLIIKSTIISLIFVFLGNPLFRKTCGKQSLANKEKNTSSKWNLHSTKYYKLNYSFMVLFPRVVTVSSIAFPLCSISNTLSNSRN